VANNEPYRLFVACELPPAAREALGDLQRSLREAGSTNLRWVRPEGIHLTLKFLGSVPPPRVGAIQDALAGAAPEPFRWQVRLAELGSFGGPARLRVVWVGLEGDVEPLKELARRVEAALGPLGFPAEGRPFAPHLTLARVRDDASAEERRRLHELLRRFAFPSLPSMTIDSVNLMRSFLEPGGARYACLSRFPRPP
jgi:2'-5' RNA ligase